MGTVTALRFIQDHNKPNHKLRGQVYDLIQRTNFGPGDPGPEHFTIEPPNFVAALYAGNDLVAACVVEPQRHFVDGDKTRYDYVSGFCVPTEHRGKGYARLLNDHLVTCLPTYREVLPTSHYIALEAFKHNWRFWVGLGYGLVPGLDTGESAIFMRRTL